MHENTKNERDERRIAEYAAKAWNVESYPAPKLCEVDGAFFRDGAPVAFYEIKKRNYKLNSLPSIWLDKKKVDKALLVAKRQNMRFLLIFEFDDGIWYCVVKNPEHWPVEQNKGPARKRDNFDRDEVYAIPIQDWMSMA
tara:strand:- start:1050 stop:1466 length:417 start_codon:yes stop_codon:yes gene_type:complete